MDVTVKPTDTERPDPLDIEAFKHVFRRHAAGVSIVTSLKTDGSPVGFTATSLASLAAVPPMATFNMAKVASAWPAMTPGNRVAIHTLGPRSRHLAQLMAADRDVRFAGEHWSPGPGGIPILREATGWLFGTVLEVHEVHNNAVVVVGIDGGELGEDDNALLYHERQYQTPAPIEP